MTSWRLRQNDASKAVGSDGTRFITLFDVFDSDRDGRRIAAAFDLSSELTSQSSE